MLTAERDRPHAASYIERIRQRPYCSRLTAHCCFDVSQDPDNPLPHRPAAQRGAVGGVVLERQIRLGDECGDLAVQLGLGHNRRGAVGTSNSSSNRKGWCAAAPSTHTGIQRMANDLETLLHYEPTPLWRCRIAILAAGDDIRLNSVGYLETALLAPPPQTQEARTVREVRIRSASVEGSVSGVWGRILKIGHCQTRPVPEFQPARTCRR